MNKLDRMKRTAEVSRMKSNILDKDVQIAEREQEIERLQASQESYKQRIIELETELKEGE